MDEQLKDMNLADSLTEELGAGEAETGTARANRRGGSWRMVVAPEGLGDGGRSPAGRAAVGMRQSVRQPIEARWRKL